MGDRVRARGRKRRSHDLEARPRDHTFVDGVPDPDVVVARALGLHVAHRGEPVPEADLHGAHGAHDPMGRVLLQDLLLVLRGSGVSLQKNVRVRVDEARKQDAIAEVDDGRARGHGSADALDPVSGDDHDRVLDVPARLDVEQAGRPDGDRGF
jgi:hypothetical protein